ncbi:hypothetical protein [Inquilinus limosus]|uniref:hypothetical protein n=1 Tax=Inquilinus limosus TaxID=171674 RepID=UPI00119821B4|nr:hypothetical protein [Inquilinus limosus]
MVSAATGGAALLLTVGWHPIAGAALFGCVLLAGGALLQATKPRSSATMELSGHPAFSRRR